MDANFFGVAVTLACITLSALFIFGLFTRPLLTVAIPVAAATLAFLFLGAYIGWEMSRI